MSISRRSVVTPILITAVTTMFAHVQSARADLVSWTAPGNGSFHNPSNWTPGVVPGPSDLVSLEQSGVTTTISFFADAETLSLEVYDGDYTFDLNGHTYDFVDIAAPMNPVGTNAYELTFIDGAVNSWSAALYGDGNWTIGNGATVALNVDLSLSGVNRMTVEGGTLTATTARVGNSGSSDADLVITGGGLGSFSSTLRIAHIAGSAGSVDVVGAGTRLEADNEIIVGSAGSGSFTVIGSAEATTGTMTTGGDGSAYVFVDSGGTLSIASNLTVNDGTFIETEEFGVVDVGGHTTLSTLAGGSADLDVTKGFLTIGADLSIGNEAAVRIGSESVVQVGGETFIATFGLLDLRNGGTLRTSTLFFAGGSFDWKPGGTLVITGEDLLVEPGGVFGETLDLQERTLRVPNNTLVVDHDAFATSLIDVNDGVLEARDMRVGQGDASFGHLRVRGATAGRVTLEEDLRLGSFVTLGSAELDVESGGTVEVGELLTVCGNCIVDLKPGGRLEAARVESFGNFDMQGGLALIGDLPAGVTEGFVLNRAGEDATFLNGTNAQLVTTNAAIGTGPGSRAEYTGDGDWFCFGALDVGRAGEPADAASVEIQSLISATGDVTIHESGLVNLRFPQADLVAPLIENHGRVIGTGDMLAHVVNAGEIEVRGVGQTQDDNTPGAMRVTPPFGGGSFEQIAAGTLAIDLFSASSSDQLHVNVPTQLGGTLRISLEDGYTPTTGDTFEIIRALDAVDAVITGTFDAIEPAGFDVVYLNNAVFVRAAAACPAEFDGTGVVGFSDLQMLLQAWGDCPAECPWNLDGIGSVGFGDLQLLLRAWGECA